MVVDIVVYSLILPSSLFGVLREESGAKLVVRERTIAPEQGGVVTEEKNFPSQHAERHRLNWTTHKTYGMGASGAATVELLPSGSITDASGDCVAWEQ
jgi:hypothetical protein